MECYLNLIPKHAIEAYSVNIVMSSASPWEHPNLRPPGDHNDSDVLGDFPSYSIHLPCIVGSGARSFRWGKWEWCKCLREWCQTDTDLKTPDPRSSDNLFFHLRLPVVSLSEAGNAWTGIFCILITARCKFFLDRTLFLVLSLPRGNIYIYLALQDSAFCSTW